MSRAVEAAIERKERLAELAIPEARKRWLSKLIELALLRYTETLASQTTIDDFEHHLGVSSTLNPFSTHGLDFISRYPQVISDVHEADDTELLSAALRDKPLGWGKKLALSDRASRISQESIFPGVSLVSIWRPSGEQQQPTAVSLLGKNKIPPLQAPK
jgi:hypothetical protein